MTDRVSLPREGRLEIFCPACKAAHAVRIDPAADPWGWNGSLERPTLTPSLNAHYPQGAGRPDYVCHSFVTDGRIKFLTDSTHALAGQEVELPAWPWPKENERG